MADTQMATDEQKPVVMDPEQEKLETLKNLAKSERDNLAAKKSAPLTQAELQTLPARQYLDNTVLPLLQSGMEQLVQERPPNPVDWMATFLLKNKGLAAYVDK